MYPKIKSWKDVLSDDFSKISISELAPRFVRGRDVWIMQTYMNLRKNGFNVNLSDNFFKDKINIIHYDDIKFYDLSGSFFVITIRADRDPVFLSNIDIVQNKSSIFFDNNYYIPHWPQPGLLRRDSCRCEKLENIAYFGNKENIDDFYKSERFKKNLESMGMRLVIQNERWWDYRNVDVVLAIRTGTDFFLSTKPASKLVNAWMAGCPAILGKESGYRELRLSEDDYFEARGPDDVLAILEILRKNPGQVARMRENGLRRAEAFSVESIVQKWVQFLHDPVLEIYDVWLHSSNFSRKYKHIKSRLVQSVWGHWADGKKLSPASKAMGALRRNLALSVYNIF